MSFTKPQFATHQWPFDLDWIPESAYLVGGYVRDVLRGRSPSYLDLDFMLPSRAVETAQAIAQHYQAGFVLLDAKRHIARVVFPHATADFAEQMGETLTDDLMRRDFTVNAIASNPHTQDLADPTGGIKDIEQGIMRMIAPQNFRDDPLRLLRAYRQAAQLDFKLDAQTQNTIRQFAPLLKQMSAERVRVELGYLLSHPHGAVWLQQLWQDGLLTDWFPHATAAGLDRIAAVDLALKKLKGIWPDALPLLTKPFCSSAQGNEAAQRTLISLVKLLGLLAPDLKRAKQTLGQLKYARADTNLVLSLLQGWEVVSMKSLGQLSRREQYFLFQQVDSAFPGLVLWLMATQHCLEDIQPLIEAYLDPNNPIAHPQPLVSGKTLMQALDLPSGPQVGKLLTALEIAQADGTIKTTEQAIAFSHQWQASQNS
ncbi:MAG: CCA tRNA nucleotidyltransferase [Thermosynechococcaceae cyanobacterium]